MMDKMTTALVKYCGGCNTRYDRVAFVEKLRPEFPAVEFLAASAFTPLADIVLVVCGCPSKCASHGHLRGRYAKLVVESLEEYDEVQQKIELASRA
jgi:3-hydroxyacyl-[acyl-carrier-protein] dehydratase